MSAFEKWKPIGGYGCASLDEVAERAWNAAIEQAARVCADQVPKNYDNHYRVHWCECCARAVLALKGDE